MYSFSWYKEYKKALFWPAVRVSMKNYALNDCPTCLLGSTYISPKGVEGKRTKWKLLIDLKPIES